MADITDPQTQQLLRTIVREEHAELENKLRTIVREETVDFRTAVTGLRTDFTDLRTDFADMHSDLTTIKHVQSQQGMTLRAIHSDVSSLKGS